ncbi:hypothetical protein NW832_10345 [Synechococcus sp. R5-16]|uniref:hypothetical protein n=1 Tax=unclassified Synechococcus TaxID=2626047 RepID=UPI0039C0D7C2
MFRIPALPYEYEVPSLSQLALVIIDMQRDFLEPGGFGEMLGNDVTQLGSIVPTLEELLDFCRQLEIAGAPHCTRRVSAGRNAEVTIEP